MKEILKHIEICNNFIMCWDDEDNQYKAFKRTLNVPDKKVIQNFKTELEKIIAYTLCPDKRPVLIFKSYKKDDVLKRVNDYHGYVIRFKRNLNDELVFKKD